MKENKCSFSDKKIEKFSHILSIPLHLELKRTTIMGLYFKVNSSNRSQGNKQDDIISGSSNMGDNNLI